LSEINIVRYAPSARVGARPAAEVDCWVGSQDLAGKKDLEQSEKSEVETLKQEMQELKKR
jgi:hypothetical protein